MSTYTRSKYNVYENGILVGTKLRPIEAAEIAGCDYGLVSTYAKDGTKFQGIYLFEIAETVECKSKNRDPKLKERERDLRMPEGFEDEWNNIRTAAKLLQTGHGKLTRKNGKKCVVMK